MRSSSAIARCRCGYAACSRPFPDPRRDVTYGLTLRSKGRRGLASSGLSTRGPRSPHPRTLRLRVRILASTLVPSRATAVEAGLSRGRRYIGHAHSTGGETLWPAKEGLPGRTSDARVPLILRRRPSHSAQDIPRGGASALHSAGRGIARQGWRTVAPRRSRSCRKARLSHASTSATGTPGSESQPRR